MGESTDMALREESCPIKEKRDLHYRSMGRALRDLHALGLEQNVQTQCAQPDVFRVSFADVASPIRSAPTWLRKRSEDETAASTAFSQSDEGDFAASSENSFLNACELSAKLHAQY